MKNVLVFKYGISRGQNSYGYRIVSLFVDGKKVASTNGGGYDMKGTVLGRYINDRFMPQIVEIAKEQLQEANRMTKYYNDKGGGIYGLIVTKNEKQPARVHLDGMTGFSVCQEVLKLLGYSLEYVTDTDKETIYQLHTEIN